MESLTSATVQAIMLLISGDAALWEIIGISFKVSCIAILIALPPSLLIAFFLAYE